ncbi:MAG: hypothetical protein JXR54_09850 [Tannerellaceae bacterium]|nr:hypothetical protein [Tannerellaceae bacterium]
MTLFEILLHAGSTPASSTTNDERSKQRLMSVDIKELRKQRSKAEWLTLDILDRKVEIPTGGHGINILFSIDLEVLTGGCCLNGISRKD